MYKPHGIDIYVLQQFLLIFLIVCLQTNIENLLQTECVIDKNMY